MNTALMDGVQTRIVTAVIVTAVIVMAVIVMAVIGDNLSPAVCCR